MLPVKENQNIHSRMPSLQNLSPHPEIPLAQTKLKFQQSIGTIYSPRMDSKVLRLKPSAPRESESVSKSKKSNRMNSPYDNTPIANTLKSIGSKEKDAKPKFSAFGNKYMDQEICEKVKESSSSEDSSSSSNLPEEINQEIASKRQIHNPLNKVNNLNLHEKRISLKSNRKIIEAIKQFDADNRRPDRRRTLQNSTNLHFGTHFTRAENTKRSQNPIYGKQFNLLEFIKNGK